MDPKKILIFKITCNIFKITCNKVENIKNFLKRGFE